MNLARLRSALPAIPAAVASDADLLASFAAARDEGAFAEVVRRHARLVRGAARRVLGDPAAADDVAQAAFLVLARKAGSAGWAPTVGPWLYRVTVRLAVRAKARAARRPAAVSNLDDHSAPGVDPAGRLAWAEVRSALDDGLARLPEYLRAPLVLCCLEGLARDEAAAALGLRPATLKGRLERGRGKLHRYLAGRGLTLPAALTGVVVTEPGGNAGFAADTATVATAYLAGIPLAPGVEALVRGWAALGRRTVAGLAGLLAACAAGVVGLAAPSTTPSSDPPKSSTPPAAGVAAAEDRTDALGDPLPPGAVARMGSARLHHGRNVRGVAVSPDGKLLASLGHDGSYKLWDAGTGVEVPYRTGTGKVFHVTPGGPDLLAVVRDEAVTRFVALPDGKEVARMPFDPASYGGDHPVELSADGRRMVWREREENGPARAWALRVTDLTAGETTTLCSRPNEFAFRTRFSADGQTLAVQFSNRDMEVWDVPNRVRVFAAAPAAGGSFESFALSADGKTLARVDPAAKTVRLWDVRSGRELPPLPDQPGDPYARLAFSPDGQTLACGANVDKLPTVRLWDWKARKALGDVPAYSGPHELAFSADGRRLVGACGDGVRVWDVAARKHAHDWCGHTYAVWAVAWSPDGRRVASGAVYSDLRGLVWDTGTGRTAFDLRGHAFGVGAVAFSPDGKLVATASQDGTARLWDARIGTLVHTFDIKGVTGNAVAFALDGRHLVVGGRNALHVVDVPARRKVQSLPFANGNPRSVGFLPGGDQLLVSTGGADARVVDLATGHEVRRPAFAGDGAGGAVLSADGRSVLTFRDGVIRLWAVSGGEGRVVAGAPADSDKHGELMDAALSPDGRVVAAAYRRGVVVYEVATGSERVRFTGHAGDVLRVSFSPDGSRLVSTSGDGTLMVWDAAGRLLPPDPAVDAKDLADAWAKLGSPDGKVGFAAVRYLTVQPTDVVPLLAGRVKPMPAADPQVVADLAGRLDSPAFADRERATKELAALGEAAEGPLREAARRPASAEVERRLAGLLAGQGDVRLTGDRLRAARAVEVLEWVGTADAKKLLAELADGAPGARRTRDAKAAIDRLGGR